MRRTAPPSTRIVVLLVLLVVAGLGSFAYRMFRAVSLIALPPIPPPPAKHERSGSGLITSIAKESPARLHMVWRPYDFDERMQKFRTQLGLEESPLTPSGARQLAELADTGNARAMLALGLIAAYAPMHSPDYGKAAALFERAAALGNARAEAELGRLHLLGRNGPMDIQGGMNHLKTARAAGNAEGLFLLSSAHRLGLVDEPNADLAAALLIEAAEQGHCGARLTIYWLLEEGSPVPVDVERAVDWLEDSARSGHEPSLKEALAHHAATDQGDRARALLHAAITADSSAAAEQLTAHVFADAADLDSCARLREFASRHEATLTLSPERALLAATFARLAVGDPIESTSGIRNELHARNSVIGDYASALLRESVPGDVVLAEILSSTPGTARQRLEELAMLGESPVADDHPRPVLLREPVYPASLKRSMITGRAVVAFTVDTQGKVREPVVSEATSPEFGDAALAAISQWYFRPARKNGQLVNARMKQPFRFALDE